MGEEVGESAIRLEKQIAYRLDRSVDHGKPADQRDLQVDKTIQDVLDMEGQDVSSWLMFPGRVSPPGGDTVSEEVTPAWSQRLSTAHDFHYRRISHHVVGLHKIAENLKKTAKEYRYNEDQIAHALDGDGE